MRNHTPLGSVCDSTGARTPGRSAARRRVACVLPTLVLVLGCGNDFGYLAYQTAESAGRTFFDLLLTEIANQFYDNLTGANDNANDNQSGDDNGNDNSAGNDNSGGNGTNDNTGGGGPDAAAGEELFAGNCASCHCADASGGCLLDAPSLVGVSAQLLQEFVVGDAAHPAKRDWTDGDIANVEAYLASLGG